MCSLPGTGLLLKDNKTDRTFGSNWCQSKEIDDWIGTNLIAIFPKGIYQILKV